MTDFECSTKSTHFVYKFTIFTYEKKTIDQKTLDYPLLLLRFQNAHPVDTLLFHEARGVEL